MRAFLICDVICAFIEIYHEKRCCFITICVYFDITGVPKDAIHINVSKLIF